MLIRLEGYWAVEHLFHGKEVQTNPQLVFWRACRVLGRAPDAAWLAYVKQGAMDLGMSVVRIELGVIVLAGCHCWTGRGISLNTSGGVSSLLEYRIPVSLPGSPGALLNRTDCITSSIIQSKFIHHGLSSIRRTESKVHPSSGNNVIERYLVLVPGLRWRRNIARLPIKSNESSSAHFSFTPISLNLRLKEFASSNSL